MAIKNAMVPIYRVVSARAAASICSEIAMDTPPRVICAVL
jgi:hypothetical protein